MNEFKEDLKSVFYIGLGALYTTGEKALELKDELFHRGKDLYEKGLVANEELKHGFKEAVDDIKGRVNFGNSKEDIIRNIDKLSEEEKNEIIKHLNKKGNDVKDGEGSK